MPLLHLSRTLALAACLLLGMAGAKAQVIATPLAVTRPYNTPTDIELSASYATPGHHEAFDYAIALPPAHGSLGSIVNGAVRYIPSADYVGEDSFTFTASTFSDGASAPATIRITMQSPLAPVASDGSFTVPFSTPADLPLAGHNPHPGSNGRVFYELASPPTHGSVMFGESNIAVYTPHAGYAGPDLFTFRVRQDAWGYSNVATARITVADAAGPVARPGSSYVPHGTATPIALAAQDRHTGGPFALTYFLHTPPAHGSVAVSGSTATYTPASGYGGWDQFAFTATSANGTSAPATVRLLVGQAVVPGLLGDTGQTRCTDSAGAATSCTALTSHPGQDGRFGRDAQVSAAAFDFAAVSGGCVEDRVTGLLWSTETLNMPWGTAPATSRCGIATGWRLPTRRELLSIVHHGAAMPTIAAAFPGTQSAPYWSSAASAANAWAVDFADGDTRLLPQGETHAARLVARPVNEPPTITLGAGDIVLSNLERPRPQTYPGWASGISPGPAREAGQRLTVSVRLLPVPGIKTLEFDALPTIDLATGDLRFTVLHRITTASHDPQGNPRDYWVSSAGRVRVEVTLQDDGGTADGGVDTTVKSFEIFVSPVPMAYTHGVKHPWKAHCIPLSMVAQDIDTDTQVQAAYPKQYWPYFKIKEYPQEGYLANYVAGRSLVTKSISVPLGNDIPANDAWGVTGLNPPVTGDTSPWGGFFVSTVCYVPSSSTFTGSDSFTYTAVDVDGNESASQMVTIEIFENGP